MVTGLSSPSSGSFWHTYGRSNPIYPAPVSSELEAEEFQTHFSRNTSARIPTNMLNNLTVNGKKLSLKQSDYKASGGEGVVYVKHGEAFKIYHNPSKMIPVGKIQELKELALGNVLGPTDIIYEGNAPVGFVMKYVSDSEFLCKLFTKGFRDKNQITHDNINGLVLNMQKTLEHIHTKKILVVDYNEMNFLVNNAYDTVYHIDVDSWQTPSYPATAIMESIRDRSIKNNKWTEGSDWFSFAVVAFQLYLGCHPYKGRHPDFAPKDWLKMMDQNVSIFNKQCRLPPASQTLDAIPKGHLKWFEGVFERGERNAPPLPDQMPALARLKPTIVQSNAKFDISGVRKYSSNLQMIRFIDGICYALTETGVYGDSKEFATFAKETGYVSRRTVKDIVPVQGDSPLIIEWNKIAAKLTYKTFAGVEVGAIESNGFFVSNRCVYTVLRDSLIEVSFINKGVKINAPQQSVANIFHNHQVFDGFVAQNMLNTCRFAIPVKAGLCVNLHMKELDKYRIIDGKYESGVLIVIVEKSGKYDRFTFILDKTFSSYTYRKEEGVIAYDINFAVKDNGVCVATNDDKIEAFVTYDKVKLLESPLDDNEPLVAFKNDIYFYAGDGLFKLASK